MTEYYDHLCKCGCGEQVRNRVSSGGGTIVVRYAMGHMPQWEGKNCVDCGKSTGYASQEKKSVRCHRCNGKRFRRFPELQSMPANVYQYFRKMGLRAKDLPDEVVWSAIQLLKTKRKIKEMNK